MGLEMAATLCAIMFVVYTITEIILYLLGKLQI